MISNSLKSMILDSYEIEENFIDAVSYFNHLPEEDRKSCLKTKKNQEVIQ